MNEYSELQREIEQELLRELNLGLDTELKGNITLRDSIYKDMIKYCEKIKQIGILGTKGQVKRGILKKYIKEIYGGFFKIQNKINAYIGQSIIITLVQKNDSGERSVYIINNTLEGISEKIFFTGQKFHGPLSYQLNEHYKVLSSSLPLEGQKNLENVAKETENRWKKGKRTIVWYPENANQALGYWSQTTGPIDEAYINFYLHTEDLLNSSNIESNINQFVLHPTLGMITADNVPGYLVGDKKLLNGIQLAIKGSRGNSLEGINDIIKDFENILNKPEFNPVFEDFIKKYAEENGRKQIQTLIKPATEQQIEKALKLINSK